MCPSRRSLRSRSYPAERLYSLYVSLVSLNHTFHDDDNAADRDDDPLLSLGSIHFLEAVGHLQSNSILHDYPHRSLNDAIRWSHRSYWSSITHDDAQQIAKSVEFPLDRYVV